MTADEFARLLTYLQYYGITGTRLSVLAGYAATNTMYRIKEGVQPAPKPLTDWMTALAVWLAENPPPAQGSTPRPLPPHNLLPPGALEPRQRLEPTSTPSATQPAVDPGTNEPASGA